ncbi:MAG TPA: LLM class flavin-dependent oxidoreductase [Streptosporangiaceae bacterium]|nr:LLM class flavin-dependent oxidoreductase [Streptosporangiaceae bacterium]
MRPFRFLATADGYPRFAELTGLARKAEAVGCSAFVLPDHLIGQYAPMPLLAVVAAATERLRVGTVVLTLTGDGKPVFEPPLGVTEGGRGLERAEHGRPVTADRPQRVERVRQRAALPADEPGPARDLLLCARA